MPRRRRCPADPHGERAGRRPRRRRHSPRSQAGQRLRGAAARRHVLPKLLDFGFARRGEVGARVRQTSVAGTPLYIAPEQVRGEAIGPQADLYSFGCLAFEMLAGRPPFTARDLSTLLDQHQRLAPPSLRSLAPRRARGTRTAGSPPAGEGSVEAAGLGDRGARRARAPAGRGCPPRARARWRARRARCRLRTRARAPAAVGRVGGRRGRAAGRRRGGRAALRARRPRRGPCPPRPRRRFGRGRAAEAGRYASRAEAGRACAGPACAPGGGRPAEADGEGRPPRRPRGRAGKGVSSSSAGSS